jgi:antitoxin VapB
MADRSTAKLFQNGRSQAVRLPQEYRFRGERVRIRRSGKGVLLEPYFDLKAWLAELDSLGGSDIMPDGRRQPITPSREVFD